MEIHREPGATLIGRKILVLCSNIPRNPKVIATRGRHRAQAMIVEGTTDKPAFAIINQKLHYIPDR